MRRIVAQTRKELTQIVRDWCTLLLALILPLILLMLLGNAISLSVTDIPIVVQDLDDSHASRQLIDAFLQFRDDRLLTFDLLVPRFGLEAERLARQTYFSAGLFQLETGDPQIVLCSLEVRPIAQALVECALHSLQLTLRGGSTKREQLHLLLGALLALTADDPLARKLRAHGQELGVRLIESALQHLGIDGGQYFAVSDARARFGTNGNDARSG